MNSRQWWRVLGSGSALFTSTLLLPLGCSKDPGPSTEGAASNAPAVQTIEPVAAVGTTGAASAQPGGTANSAAATAAAAAPDCKNPDHWETQTVASLKDGALQLPKAGMKVAPLSWAPCPDGQPRCEKLSLAPSASVLAVGAIGNHLKLAVRDACDGGEQTVTVSAVEGEPELELRGESFVFESAALGGDRVLLGGFAKHPSETSKEGYAKREYLLTRREFGDKKFEAARNKQLFVPYSASSQLVHVRGATQCTGLFWKIGVEECNFAGPGTDVFALFGGHVIFADPATSKGMAWDAKQGPRVLFDSLDWIVTDNVNVAWSSGGKLYTAQPRWDLPELKAAAAPGAPGEKPLAFGCGRTLRPAASGWELRDIAKGQVWTLDAERFPKTATSTTAVMNCEFVLFASGERVSVYPLGTPQPVAGTASAAVSAEVPPGPASAAPPAETEPTTAASKAP